MSSNIFDRTQKLIGEDRLERLKSSHILIVGVGGVGGYVLESLVRAGVGKITIVDPDCVDVTNLNRQVISLRSNAGVKKTIVAKKRALEINPNAVINDMALEYNKENHNKVFNDKTDYTYVADCFDSVANKIAFIEHCAKFNIKIISAMGSGNRVDPSFKIMDIYKTEYDPLAKAVRTKLNKKIVSKLKVCCDSTPPLIKSPTPASISYAPAMMGLLMAKEIILDITNANII